MDNWIDFLVDSAKIRAIFHDAIPHLDGVDLHEIILHRDGPSVALRFDLSTFPESPPKKWVIEGYNCIQLQLSCIGITSISIGDWQIKNIIDLVLIRENKNIRLLGFDFKKVIKFEILADFVMVDKISAYQNASCPACPVHVPQA